MKETEFFETQTVSSRIKANIVSEYFPNYCRIIIKKHVPKEIRYIDLFAGPGIYADGNHSTPLLIAKRCHLDESLRNLVKMIFNDNKYAETLTQNFNKVFPNGSFKFTPHFGKSTVGENEKITEFLMKNTSNGKLNDYPSLLFIDPFGYKGIETKILATFMKNWANEIFLFVNTKRIHAALENDKFEELMLQLFPNNFNKLKTDRKYKSTVNERLNLIINNLGNEYETLLGQKIFFTAFKFQEEDSDGTSHYILHITKHQRGYDLIKTTYNDFANVGTVFDGVNTYTFDAKQLDNHSEGMFDYNSINIDILKDVIYNKHRGKILSAFELFEGHHTNGLYSRRHYTDALRRLQSEGKLESTFTDSKSHEVTVLLSKSCILKFN